MVLSRKEEGSWDVRSEMAFEKGMGSTLDMLGRSDISITETQL